jgi:hypothetical protein
MSEGQIQSKDFYAEKGMTRHMVILTHEHRNALKAESKKVSLTQGEFIEVLLDNTDFDTLSEKFKEKKAGKTEGKLTKADILKKMTNLTPEQLAAIEAIVTKGAA